MSESNPAKLLAAVRELRVALERPSIQYSDRPGRTYVHLPDDRQFDIRNILHGALHQDPDSLPLGVEPWLIDLLDDLHQIPLWHAEEPNQRIRKWLAKVRQVETALVGQKLHAAIGPEPGANDGPSSSGRVGPVDSDPRCEKEPTVQGKNRHSVSPQFVSDVLAVFRLGDRMDPLGVTKAMRAAGTERTIGHTRRALALLASENDGRLLRVSRGVYQLASSYSSASKTSS